MGQLLSQHPAIRAFSCGTYALYRELTIKQKEIQEALLAGCCLRLSVVSLLRQRHDILEFAYWPVVTSFACEIDQSANIWILVSSEVFIACSRLSAVEDDDPFSLPDPTRRPPAFSILHWQRAWNSLRFLPCPLSKRSFNQPVDLLLAAATTCWRDPARSKQLSTVAILGF